MTLWLRFVSASHYIVYTGDVCHCLPLPVGLSNKCSICAYEYPYNVNLNGLRLLVSQQTDPVLTHAPQQPIQPHVPLSALWSLQFPENHATAAFCSSHRNRPMFLDIVTHSDDLQTCSTGSRQPARQLYKRRHYNNIQDASSRLHERQSWSTFRKIRHTGVLTNPTNVGSRELYSRRCQHSNESVSGRIRRGHWDHVKGPGSSHSP